MIGDQGLLTRASGRVHFSSDASYRNNALTFASLAHLLAQRDVVLIVRVPTTTTSSSDGNNFGNGNGGNSGTHHQGMGKDGGERGDGSGSGLSQFWALVPPTVSTEYIHSFPVC